LQCVAVCCSVLQCVAVCCSVLWCAAVCCSVLQCVAVCCSVLQCAAVCCSVLQREGVRGENAYSPSTETGLVCWSALQCVAVCCGVLQFVISVWACEQNMHIRTYSSSTETGLVCWSALQCVPVCCGVLQCAMGVWAEYAYSCFFIVNRDWSGLSVLWTWSAFQNGTKKLTRPPFRTLFRNIQGSFVGPFLGWKNK